MAAAMHQHYADQGENLTNVTTDFGGRIQILETCVNDLQTETVQIWEEVATIQDASGETWGKIEGMERDITILQTTVTALQDRNCDLETTLAYQQAQLHRAQSQMVLLN